MTSLDALQLAKAKRVLSRWSYDPAWGTPAHAALVDEVAASDPLFAKARDVILGGQAAIAAVDDRVLFDLLLDINDHAPSEAAIARREVTAGGELAQELWPTGIMTMFSEPDAGEGDWPEPPERTDKDAEPDGAVQLLTPTAAGVEVRWIPKFKRLWESDDREYYFRVKREVQKAHAEMAFRPMFYHEFAEQTDALRFINTRRMAQKRAKKAGKEESFIYMLYEFVAPESFGYVIVTDYGDGATGSIPSDRTAAMALFHPWLNTIEEGRLGRHSQQYGKQFQGTSGDGRRAMLRNEVKKAAKAGAAVDETAAQLRTIQIVTGKTLEQISKMIWEKVRSQAKETGVNPEIIAESNDQLRHIFDRSVLDPKKAMETAVIPVDQLRDYFRRAEEVLPDLKVRGGIALPTAISELIAACTQLSETSNRRDHVSVSWVQNGSLPALEGESPGVEETPEAEIEKIFGGAA